MNRKFVILRRYLSRVSVKPVEMVTVDDLKRFKNAYDALGDVPVDLAYLLSADKVVVLVTPNGEWYGGYAVNGGSLRYLEGFSPKQIEDMEDRGGFAMSEASEITCIWNNAKIKGVGLQAPLFLYYNCVADVLSLDKSIIIGGSVKQKVWENFEHALPHELFYGAVEVENKLETGKIVYNNREGIQECFLTYIEKLTTPALALK